MADKTVCSNIVRLFCIDQIGAFCELSRDPLDDGRRQVRENMMEIREFRKCENALGNIRGNDPEIVS
jgi:hypothetical protein